MSHAGARLGEAALFYAARGDQGTVQLLSFTRDAGDFAPPRGGALGMGVKLIVQIPCLNEEGTLPATLATIPRHIPGIESIEILVIDDGSTDATVETA
jgi:hypothetical protein